MNTLVGSKKVKRNPSSTLCSMIFDFISEYILYIHLLYIDIRHQVYDLVMRLNKVDDNYEVFKLNISRTYMSKLVDKIIPHPSNTYKNYKYLIYV